jgi:putative ABC transport system substrate-binding protein
VWLVAVRAQRSEKVAKIAIVHPSSPTQLLIEGDGRPMWSAFFSELRRLDRVEGANLVVERYSAENMSERHDAIARAAVTSKPDLIFAVSNTMVRHVRAMTDTIPIVAITTDPVAMGLVASLARPGGNVTGASTDAGLDVWAKRFQILREVIPSVSKVGFLAQQSWEAGSYGDVIREMARNAGVLIVGGALASPINGDEYRRVFGLLRKEGAEAVVVNEGPEHLGHQQLIVDLCRQFSFPAMYPYRHFTPLGGLIAYSTDLSELYLHAARQINQIKWIQTC